MCPSKHLTAWDTLPLVLVAFFLGQHLRGQNDLFAAIMGAISDLCCLSKIKWTLV